MKPKLTFEELLAELRKDFNTQQSFESDMEYAVRCQKWMSVSRVWEADDATDYEFRMEELFNLLNEYLT
jgi:hypothetical protein